MLNNNGTITRNNGAINVNNGSVDMNTSTGTITTNNGKVSSNDGTITTNNKTGTIEDNVSGNGKVESNYGVVTNNLNTVNCNYGKVGTNKGKIEFVEKEGTVTSNEVWIGINWGTITDNTGTIDINEITDNGRGTVTNNSGTIETNYSIVSSNADTVKTNYGTVSNTSANGYVLGTVEICNGGSVSGGEITTMNDGEANNCTITNMTGGVARGSSTIKSYSGGYVENGITITNYTGGKTENDVQFIKPGSKVPCAAHSLQTVAEIAATCKDTGVKQYYHCTVCDRDYSDNTCTDEITDLAAWKNGAGKIEKTTTHTPGTAYSHNDTVHWQTCTVCNADLAQEAHKESGSYTHDITNHWKTCTVCGATKLNSTAHNYDSNGKCTACGYDSTCTHTYGTAVANGTIGHTKTCSKCGDVITEDHISGGPATATSPEICNVCGYELSPALGGGASGGAAVSVPEPVIPESPYRVFLFDTVPQVKTAAQGASVELKMDGWNTLPLWFMKEIAARRDLTIHMTYRYEGLKYDVTFPAGMVINCQDDEGKEIDYFGPLKLADMAIRAKGSCVVTK